MLLFNIFLILTVICAAKFCASQDYSDEETAKKFLEFLNANKSQEYKTLSNANWNYSTNLNPFTKKILLQETARSEQLDRIFWEELIKYKYETFKDPLVRRQFKKLSILGSAALGDKAQR
ncbi:angiotensin-converting enzyme-like protein, partial [Dinothrombium tinctorium]